MKGEMKNNKDLIGVTEVTESTVKNRKLIPTNTFPLEIFPKRLMGIIQRLSRALHVEPEVVACCMLPIISGAIGNTIKVSPKQGWDEAGFIWLIFIATTGYGKTHVIDTLNKPIRNLQANEYRNYRRRLDEFERGLREDNGNLADRPWMRHYMVSDTTIEALADVFESDPRGTIINKDELAGLILGLNQYKGKGNDRQHFLELFNAGSWKIDRKIGSRFIPNTGASIIGGIQPKVLSKIFGNDSIDEGLLPRFLLLHADEHQKKFSRESINEDDIAHWKSLIDWCYTVPLNINNEGVVEPMILTLSKKALNIFSDFYNEYMALQQFLNDRAKAFIPKLITYCLKFAGVLHAIKTFTEKGELDRKIDQTIMKDTIKLTRFFAGQSIKALQLYDQEKPSLNEYQKRLIETLDKIQGEVKNGKLRLSRILEVFNNDLPDSVKHTPEKIRGMLKEFQLKTEKSTGNLSVLVWEDNKIKKLFS